MAGRKHCNEHNTVKEQRIGRDNERVHPIWRDLAEAASISGAVATLTTSTCRPIATAAVPTSLIAASAATELVGLTSRAKREASETYRVAGRAVLCPAPTA